MEVTIDALGRVLIPKKIRERLGVIPNSKLDLTVEDGSIKLEPKLAEVELVETECGLVVIKGLPPITADQLQRLKTEMYEDRFRRKAG